MTISDDHRKALEGVREDLREIAVDQRDALGLLILGSLIRTTPVDTGRARGGWATSSGTVGDFVPAEGKGSYEPPDAVELVERWSDADPVGLFFIYNNLEYIVPLDDGHSKQAPGGMTAVANQEIDHFLRREGSE